MTIIGSQSVESRISNNVSPGSEILVGILHIKMSQQFHNARDKQLLGIIKLAKEQKQDNYL